MVVVSKIKPFKKILQVLLVLNIVLQMSINSFAKDYSNTISDRLKNTITICINSPKVFVRNVEKRLDSTNSDIVPFILEGRTMVPLRFLSENLNATVKWDPVEEKATISYEGNTAIIGANSDTIIINNKEYSIEVRSLLINGRLYIPLRILTEQILRKNVDYYSNLIFIGDNENIFNDETEKEMLNQVKYLFYETVYSPRVVSNEIQLDVPSIFEEINIPESSKIDYDLYCFSKVDSFMCAMYHDKGPFSNDEITIHQHDIIGAIIAGIKKRNENPEFLEYGLYNIHGLNTLKIEYTEEKNGKKYYEACLIFVANEKTYFLNLITYNKNMDLWKNVTNNIMESIRIGKFDSIQSQPSIVIPRLIAEKSSN